MFLKPGIAAIINTKRYKAIFFQNGECRTNRLYARVRMRKDAVVTTREKSEIENYGGGFFYICREVMMAV